MICNDPTQNTKNASIMRNNSFPFNEFYLKERVERCNLLKQFFPSKQEYMKRNLISQERKMTNCSKRNLFIIQDRNYNQTFSKRKLQF